jgi:hypothetical protein
MWETELFDEVLSAGRVEDCLKGMADWAYRQMQTQLERESEESPGVQSSAWSQEDRSEDSSARKGSTEYRTQK